MATRNFRQELFVHRTVVFVTGDDTDAKPLPVAAGEFTLTTKDGKVVPPMTVRLLPKDAKDGKASRFVGTNPGIGNVAEFVETVAGKIDGRRRATSKCEFRDRPATNHGRMSVVRRRIVRHTP